MVKPFRRSTGLDKILSLSVSLKTLTDTPECRGYVSAFLWQSDPDPNLVIVKIRVHMLLKFDGFYWVPQKLPQIYTVIICIGKVAGFAVYTCGKFWVTQYIDQAWTGYPVI